MVNISLKEPYLYAYASNLYFSKWVLFNRIPLGHDDAINHAFGIKEGVLIK